MTLLVRVWVASHVTMKPMLGADGKPVIGADGRIVMVDAEERSIHNEANRKDVKDKDKGKRKRKFQKKTRQVFLVPEHIR